MHEAARLRPVVIDESLTDLETLLLAREMGYTGVALKACKGQTHAMLMAAAAQKFGMFLCVQDLTCPGRVADSLGRHRRARAGQRRHRGQRAPVRPERERAVGGAFPGAVHHPRRRDADRPADGPRARGGAAASGVRVQRVHCARPRRFTMARWHDATKTSDVPVHRVIVACDRRDVSVDVSTCRCLGDLYVHPT